MQRSRIFHPDVIDQFMQGARICFPVKFHDCAHGFRGDIVWIDGQGAIQRQFCFIVTGKITVPQRNPVKCVEVARVKLKCALQAMYRFFPASLPPLDVSRQLEYLRIIRQTLTGEFKFTQSGVIIAVSYIKIPRTRQMRFPSSGRRREAVARAASANASRAEL